MIQEEDIDKVAAYDMEMEENVLHQVPNSKFRGFLLTYMVKEVHKKLEYGCLPDDILTYTDKLETQLGLGATKAAMTEAEDCKHYSKLITGYVALVNDLYHLRDSELLVQAGYFDEQEELNHIINCLSRRVGATKTELDEARNIVKDLLDFGVPHQELV